MGHYVATGKNINHILQSEKNSVYKIAYMVQFHFLIKQKYKDKQKLYIDIKQKKIQGKQH